MTAQDRGRKEKGVSTPYQYTESGLDNVTIEGVKIVTDDNGNEVYCIPNVGRLHQVIAHAIIRQEAAITNKEFRFLRTEMGLTQDELAKLLKVSRATVNRWEKGKESIDARAEFMVRVLAADKLDVDPDMSAAEMARHCGWKSDVTEIRIDGSDPENYRPIAA